MLPPPSSKTTSPEKDKIKDEGRLLSKYGVTMLPLILTAVNLFETAAYILLLIRSGSRSSYSTRREFEAIQQLKVLKTWHIVATVTALVSCWLRRWSFATLDRFFTYQLTIRSGHKLVQTGPYTYLRHPSYTGAMLTSFASHAILFRQGLWDVLMALGSRFGQEYLVPIFPSLPTLTSSLPLWHTMTGPSGGTLFVLFSAMSALWMLAKRVQNEEQMLKEHFGKDWDEYASKRWRFIPFLY
ncbi:hypothetical protein BGZ83_008385 [Gryganskiella cystojenkinii]|nr:hypothetical protein BGZ83_008385 [Gryganskiella cystojenkinii]